MLPVPIQRMLRWLLLTACLASCASLGAQPVVPPPSPEPPTPTLTPPPSTRTPIPTTPTRTPRPTPTLQPGQSVVTTTMDLVGTWEMWYSAVGDWVYIRYHEDGTFEVARTIAQLDTEPVQQGSFFFDGDDLLIQDRECPAGRYQLLLTREGDVPVRLDFRVIRDRACHVRAADLGRGMPWVGP
jgi:hypothetical protein